MIIFPEIYYETKKSDNSKKELEIEIRSSTHRKSLADFENRNQFWSNTSTSYAT